MSMKDNIINTLDRLVKVPSISGTEKENLAAKEIYSILNEIPYFNEQKESVKINKIDKDSFNRGFVSAFLQGKNSKSKDVIILCGHYDVVDIGEFGALKDVAFDFKKCTEQINKLSLDEDAIKDLNSKDWIFGRGTADMKYGLALYIEILRELSKERNFNGNILFLAVPGEESNSEGMLGAAPYLSKLQDEGFNFKGLFLSECCTPKYIGDEVKKIYIGSVGKIMPLFFCVGKATHVGNPFGGLNPNLLVSEINKLMEVNIELSDSWNQDITPPPVCLKQEDLKDLYSVQSPLYSYSYYNLLTLKWTPEEIMKKLKNIAYEAFENTVNIINKNYQKYEKLCGGNNTNDLDIQPKILTYEELYNEVKSIDENFEKQLNKKIDIWKNEKLDNQTIGVKIIEETFEKYPNKEPAIIMAYNVPYYPHKYLNKSNPQCEQFLEYLDETLKFAKEEYNLNIEKENFFMGISDLSYTGLEEGFNIESVCNNMPGIGNTYIFPEKELKNINIPSVVFGGFGKDFHKYTERLNIPYSMDIVPELYMHILNKMLK